MGKGIVQIKTKGAFALKNSLRKLRTTTADRIKKEAADEFGQMAYDQILAAVSSRDLGPSDFRAMDHPYARRHGSIAVNPGKEYTIHQQTGRLRNSLAKRIVKKFGGAGGGQNHFAQVGFIDNPPHYMNYVVEGTRVMLPRDPINATVESREFKKQIKKAAARIIKKHGKL